MRQRQEVQALPRDAVVVPALRGGRTLRTRTLTAAGRGTWGADEYLARLVTLDTRYAHSQTDERRLVQRFLLEFGRPGYVDARSFASEAERGQFLQKNFRTIALEDIPPEPVPERLPPDELIGETLGTVTFVRNYLQLGFDGAGTFSFYLWPEVFAGERRWKLGDAGYRDALCGLIDQKLTAWDELLDLGLVLDFDNARLALQLREDAHPESVEYFYKGGWMSWSPGDAPWETPAPTP